MKKLILLLVLIFSLPVAAQNFTIGKNTFLLNGKPFTVKAAECIIPVFRHLTGNIASRCVRHWA